MIIAYFRQPQLYTHRLAELILSLIRKFTLRILFVADRAIGLGSFRQDDSINALILT